MQQLRDLEQQLKQSTQQRQLSVPSVEEEFLDVGLLQKYPPQEKNLNYIRTIEKEKREAFEVCILYKNCKKFKYEFVIAL